MNTPEQTYIKKLQDQVDKLGRVVNTLVNRVNVLEREHKQTRSSLIRTGSQVAHVDRRISQHDRILNSRD